MGASQKLNFQEQNEKKKYYNYDAIFDKELLRLRLE